MAPTMRSHKHSRPDTFPFLAVLLCAMGSLILLLLVIDRRARVVAQLKALQATTAAAAEDEKAVAARRAELDQRRQALHTALAEQDQDVQDQVRDVRQRTEATLTTLHAAKSRVRGLQEQLQTKRVRLTQEEGKLAAQQTEAEHAAEQTQASQAELGRLSTDLRRMEQTLADLKAARQRQQQTYSLVPYRGRRGDNRRPLYIECTMDGLIFHPDRVVLRGLTVTAQDVRSEIERRIERQRAGLSARDGKADQRPYLLMLVRPDGIVSYYHTQTALKGLALDFGYEFIDAGWILDFPDDDSAPTPQPWMSTGKTAVPRNVPMPMAPPQHLPLARVPGSASGGPIGGETTGSPGLMGPPEPEAPARETASPRWRFGLRLPVPEPSRLGGDLAGAQGERGGLAGAPSPGTGSLPDTAEPRLPGSGPGDRSLASTAPLPSTPSVPAPPASTTNTGVLLRQERSSGGTGLQTRPDGSGAPSHVTNFLAGVTPLQTPPVPQGDPPWPAGAPGGRGSAGLPTAGSGGPSFSGQPGTSVPGGAPLPPGTHISGPPASKPQSSADAGDSSSGLAAPSIPSGPSTGSVVPRLGAPALIPAIPGANQAKPADDVGNTASTAPGGSSGRTGGESNPDDPRSPAASLAAPVPGPLVPEARQPTARSAPSRPGSLVSNRDWIIPIECTAETLEITLTGQRIATAALTQAEGGSSALREAVQQLIARRQATVRPGEPLYRPQIRFRVRPDGLRTYYLAYPVLETLRVPMSRENVERDEQPIRRRSTTP